MTGVARLHCLYLAGVSVVRCQIVFTVVVYLLSVSVFQVLKLFSPGRVSVYLCPSWRLCTAGFTAPALPMLSAPPLCLESAPALPAHLTSTVFWSCLIKTICFSLAIGSRAFCAVTVLTNLKVILLFCFLHKQINILDTFYCNLVCAGGCCAVPLQTMWSGPIRFQNGSCSKT